MEPRQYNEESIVSPHKKVTPVSKYLVMILFIAMPFIGGYVGYSFAPEKLVFSEATDGAQSQTAATTTEKNYDDSNPVDIEVKYKESKYRVVSVVKNPFYPEESKYDSLVIAAERGVNDYTCGSKNVPEECHLFLESSYYNISTPVSVGTWTGGSIETDTIKFISPSKIEFKTVFGDAGYGSETTFELDLETGSSTKISSREFYSE